MKTIATFLLLLGLALACIQVATPRQITAKNEKLKDSSFDSVIDQHAMQILEEGRKTFRFDTFGDERFWGDTLQLHKAIEGANLGGLGPGVSPTTALSVGLKVDIEALPSSIVQSLRQGRVNLNDPATTLALLKLNAVVGVTGHFNDRGTLRSVGIQCALCHSTVDNSLTFGIGHRLDGWANRDLNVGAIIALAPNLEPIAKVLGVDVGTVLKVLNSWGPGKFDAELILDGKAFRPAPEGGSAATLLPPAFGLAGVIPGPDGVPLHTGMPSLQISRCTVKGRFTIPDWPTPCNFPLPLELALIARTTRRI